MVASDDIRAPRAAKTLGERLKPAPRVRFALLLGVAAAELLILSLCFSLDFLLTSDTFAAAVLSTLANALPMSMILAAALLGIGFARPGALSPILRMLWPLKHVDCDDEMVETCVCQNDPFCCDQGWDEQCVGVADQQCNAMCGG